MRRLEKEYEELKSGLTWKSFLGILYAAIVIQPAVILLSLVSGATLSWMAAQWIVVILFVELARIAGHELTQQETFIIWLMAATAAQEFFFLFMVQNAYWRTSFITQNAIINGQSLANLVPTWFAPSFSSPIYNLRTFLHPSWIAPISIALVGSLLWKATDISLGYLNRQLYIETEKLPFPFQVPTAEAILTISRHEKKRTRVLVVSAVIAMFYALFVYGIPLLGYSVLRLQSIPFAIPVPWVDLTKFIEPALPGAAIGIATDLITFALGFMIPFNVIVSMFVTSFAIYFVANPIAVRMGFSTPERPIWEPGWSLGTIWQRSTLNLWAGFIIGLAIAAAIVPILAHPRTFARSLKGLTKLSKAQRRAGILPLWLIFGIFISSTFGGIMLFHFLVPDFPIWVLIALSMGWTLLWTLASGRASATTGFSITVPTGGGDLASLRQPMFSLVLGGKYSNAWFAPLTVSQGGDWTCQMFKLCQLTKTTPGSYIKAYLIAFPIAYIVGFVYISVFWSIAPIPSAVFPWTQITWPTNLIFSSLWITNPTNIFNPTTLAASFSIVTAAYALSTFAHLPISFMGIVVGAASPLPNALTMLIGGIVGQILMRRTGKDWWNSNKGVIVGGIFIGEGIIIGIFAAILLVMKSTLALPY